MYMSCTFVTALYNINREHDGDGRRWEEYLAWFKDTLQIRAPLVVFIPDYLQEFVEKNRNPDYLTQTRVIIQPLEQIPYAYMHANIQNIIDSEWYRNKICDASRIECKLPCYTIIQYSKFVWLEKVADANPFGTVNFFWIDAGVSRFVDVRGPCMHLAPSVPPAGKIVIQCSPFIANYPMENYLWSNQCLMCGTMFGGDAEACNTVGAHVKAFLDEHVVAKNEWINNEQILLAYFAMVEHRNFFHLVPNTTNQHLPLFRLLFG